MAPEQEPHNPDLAINAKSPEIDAYAGFSMPTSDDGELGSISAAHMSSEVTAMHTSSTPESFSMGQLMQIQPPSSVIRAARADILNSRHPYQTASVGLGVLALQGLSRLQASWVFVPEIAINVFKNSHSPTEAAVAGGAALGIWCAAVAGATAEGLIKYPKAMKQFGNKFPSFVDFFKESLPGFEKPTPRENGVNSKLQYLGSRLWTRFRRGLTVTGIGSVAYAGTALAKGVNRKDAHKLNLNASLDGAVVTGGIVFGLGEAIIKVARDNPALAANIQNTASKIWIWYGVAGLSMAEQYIENKVKKHKKRKTAPSEDSVEAGEPGEQNMKQS